MKKIYLIVVVLFMFTNIITKAQTTLTTAVDFTVTDVHGASHNLFSILNSGKYVCIDFFFTTCPPCQQTVPFFKQAYQNYGCNTQDIYFLSIDNGDTNAEVVTYENTYIGGNSGFPVASGIDGAGNAVCSAYGIGAYPTYILIAPNKQIIEQDMWPITNAASFNSFFTSHSLTQKPCMVGIEEKEDNINVAIFPNPASNNLTIETTNNTKIEGLKIYNCLGELLINEPVNALLKHNVNIEDLKSGIYFLEIITENKITIIKKFSKQ